MEHHTLPAVLDSLATLSDLVGAAALNAGLDERAAWQVQLAVDEAATNIVQHGYPAGTDGTIELGCAVDGADFVVTLRDHGQRFDPGQVPAPDLDASLEERQPGGLGIYLMGRLMDSVTFSFDETQGNLLMLTKRISAPPSAIQIFLLDGRFDAVRATELLAPAQTAIDAGAQRIGLDLGGITFLSSSGLRALLLLRRALLAQGGTLRLFNLRPHVLEVFELTGFTQVFAITPGRADTAGAPGLERV